MQGTQGHTRTGDNEIRVNEGWKKPRPDGLEELLSEIHTETRHGISVQENSIVGGTRWESLGKCKNHPLPTAPLSQREVVSVLPRDKMLKVDDSRRQITCLAQGKMGNVSEPQFPFW